MILINATKTCITNYDGHQHETTNNRLRQVMHSLWLIVIWVRTNNHMARLTQPGSSKLSSSIEHTTKRRECNPIWNLLHLGWLQAVDDDRALFQTVLHWNHLDRKAGNISFQVAIRFIKSSCLGRTGSHIWTRWEWSWGVSCLHMWWLMYLYAHGNVYLYVYTYKYLNLKEAYSTIYIFAQSTVPVNQDY